MLEVKNLEKHFGDFVAVKGVSFSVKAGEVLGFLGPNGAGKSTTMRMITGFLPPSYRAMTVRDYLAFVASVRSDACPDVKKAVDEVIVKAKLEKVAGQTIETLSKGYRQRTAFAAAIIHDPKVLIMDEPTDGLDPNQKFTVREMIKSMAKEGKAIIISTHILEEVDAVCSKVVVIADGEKKFDGTPAELKAKDPSGKLDVVFRNLTMKQ